MHNATDAQTNTRQGFVSFHVRRRTLMATDVTTTGTTAYTHGSEDSAPGAAAAAATRSASSPCRSASTSPAASAAARTLDSCTCGGQGAGIKHHTLRAGYDTQTCPAAMLRRSCCYHLLHSQRKFVIFPADVRRAAPRAPGGALLACALTSRHARALPPAPACPRS